MSILKTILIILLLSFCSMHVFTQKWEWQWCFYLKAVARHNLCTYQDVSGVTERNIKTPDGFYNLIATTPSDVEINPGSGLKFEDFSFCFPVGFYAVSPVFLSTGIEYQPLIFRSV